MYATLRTHPQIMQHGEILNHRHKYDLSDDGYQRFVDALNADLHPTRSTLVAIGCNMHAFQPDRTWAHWQKWERAWDALADDRSVKVVLLRRLDALAQLASWRIAYQLGEWGIQPATIERPTVRLDPHELRWFMRWNQMLFEKRLSYLTNHEILPITYESLCDDWDETIRRVQAFLGVNVLSLRQPFSKNETRPLEDVVENIKTLRRVQGQEAAYYEGGP